MANYYLDTEFVEGTRKPVISLPSFGTFNQPRHHLQFISVGIVADDGREYYAVSNEFDIDWAWNKYSLVENPEFVPMLGESPYNLKHKENYWLRDNVLKTIYNDFWKNERYARQYHWSLVEPFCLKTLKNLIQWQGKPNIVIANEVCEFIYGKSDSIVDMSTLAESRKYEYGDSTKNPVFYTYFGDYDWVAFCSLFEDMAGLPKGFPMYAQDLKQDLDRYITHLDSANFFESHQHFSEQKQIPFTIDDKVQVVKRKLNLFPEPTEHHALLDAQWNKRLHQSLTPAFNELDKPKKVVEHDPSHQNGATQE